ncbi:conserved hypothetical protein [Neospora caninum Liverpool]|uniref:Uncharacterized protein n=1 Tax=Neospora caninum (strain Liverpool) TaxID=572307 RepID=F0V864_NEOCL|nr:conserved hypothetical protein [Neospora caninum Liverpool]CBZ49905.1 conserved hypothetical protein [Neospora caninum Liverpool]CEL64492.1 TPA: hypothetical protein BN1204_003890 [Neospora caninum Liverpool]|eukprot:XP_003879940.1 conserved hypothetical protein [Neospora caninum Liverpool]
MAQNTLQVHDSLRLLSYDELFKSSEVKTIQKFQGFKRQNTLKGDTRAKNELLSVLRQQRVLVDDNAIHFIAEARSESKADARNSVFKLAQKYKVLPDTENVKKIKQLFGKVREDDSGDEDWEPSFRRLPDCLKTKRGVKLMEDDVSHEILLGEIDTIEDESSKLGGNVVTLEPVKEEPEEVMGRVIDEHAGELGLSAGKEDGTAQAKAQNEESDDDDEDDAHFDNEDLKVLNDMQKEFIGNNLTAWIKDIKKAYESGVKLVKVNALGYKFIRIVTLKDMVLSIRQPHTQSKVKLERQVAITEVINVQLGRDSKEFRALDQLVDEGKEPADTNPTATLCAVVDLPKNRSLSLVFLEEDQRNGFVFYLRVLLKKAKVAAQQLEASP